MERNRSEKVESRQIELAEETLTKFYEAEDVFRVIRSGLGYRGEGSSRDKSDTTHLSDEVNARIDSIYSTIERMRKYDDFFASISLMVARVKALFGAEVCDAFLEIVRTRNELILATQFMMEDAARPPADQDDMREWRNVRFGSFSKKDDLHMKLEESKSKLEKALLPIVRSRLNLDK